MCLVGLFPSFCIPSGYHQGFISDHTNITKKNTMREEVVEGQLLIITREKKGVALC